MKIGAFGDLREIMSEQRDAKAAATEVALRIKSCMMRGGRTKQYAPIARVSLQKREKMENLFIGDMIVPLLISCNLVAHLDANTAVRLSRYVIQSAQDGYTFITTACVYVYAYVCGCVREREKETRSGRPRLRR